MKEKANSSPWKGGVADRINGPVPLKARTGLGSTSDNPLLEPTTPSAPAKEASRHFLNGRSHPSFPRRGVRLSPQLFSMPSVSSKKMWDMLTLFREGSTIRSMAEKLIGSLIYGQHAIPKKSRAWKE